jgi:hypothetical protein
MKEYNNLVVFEELGILPQKAELIVGDEKNFIKVKL